MSASIPMAAGREAEPMIRLESVSRFYGDVLGVNRISLEVSGGITSLIGPNGAGKSTLMNLIAGLIPPTRGRITVLGVTPSEAESLFPQLGFCTQYDVFPAGARGRDWVRQNLLWHGYSRGDAAAMCERALARVGMTAAAAKKLESYSKGMRQRIRLAQILAFEPRLLILDEPLNGLDPLARTEMAALFRSLAAEGRGLLISSHILHEVEAMSDRVILLRDGYLAGEGGIGSVREEIQEHELQWLVRCPKPARLAALGLEARAENGRPLINQARVFDRPEPALLLGTPAPAAFFLALNAWIARGEIEVETITPADDDLDAVYRYLFGQEGA